jgi:iron complex transport system substrate-binding protein
VGFQVERQKAIQFEYEGMVFEEGFRTDIMVDNQVVVELKSVERLAPVHSRQLRTYLKLTNKPVGLLINFGAVTLREGLHRVVNDILLCVSAAPREPISASRYRFASWRTPKNVTIIPTRSGEEPPFSDL